MLEGGREGKVVGGKGGQDSTNTQGGVWRLWCVLKLFHFSSFSIPQIMLAVKYNELQQKRGAHTHTHPNTKTLNAAKSGMTSGMALKVQTQLVTITVIIILLQTPTSGAGF